MDVVAGRVPIHCAITLFRGVFRYADTGQPSSSFGTCFGIAIR
jgi:hypothetical protein